MNMAPGHFKAGRVHRRRGQMRVTGSDPLHEGRNAWVSKDSPYPNSSGQLRRDEGKWDA